MTSLVKYDRVLEVERFLIKFNIDFCFIQETHLKSKFVQPIKNYTICRDDSGVGSLIFSRNKFKFERVVLPSATDIQVLGIKVIGGGNKGLFLFSIYIPCGSRSGVVERDLKMVIDCAGASPFVLGGDLNTGGPSNEIGVQRFVANNADLVNLIVPSGPTFRTGSTLDYFMTATNVLTSRKCRSYDIMWEHKAIMLTASVNMVSVNNPARKVFKWRKTDWRDFNKKASLYLKTVIPEDRNLTNAEVDVLAGSLCKDITDAMEELLPKGLIGRGKPLALADRADHFFKERRRLKRVLRALLNKWNPDPDRVEHVRRSIKAASVEIDKIIKESINNQLEEKLENINENRNRFRTIKSLTSGGSRSSEVRLMSAGGTEITSNRDKCKEVAGFYEDLYMRRVPGCDVIGEVVERVVQLEDVAQVTEFSLLNSALRPSVSSSHFTLFKEVGSSLKALPNKTSSGCDGIPNVVLKRLPIGYVVEMVKLFNHCINNSYFPLGWKKATIIPKKAGVIQSKDLRPISLTSNVGKVLESKVMDKLMAGMPTGTIPEHQFGFMKGHSTVDALDILKRRLDWMRVVKREFTIVCSLDIRKAFDSVWHEGLVYKVAECGIDLCTTKMVASFLSERVASVRIGGIYSDEFRIGRGVPQGSRLGPMLYNIYTGDVKIKQGPEDFFLQYADDTLIGSSSINAGRAVSVVKDAVEEMSVYLDNWGIELNAEKTVCMLVRPTRKAIKQNGICPYTGKISINRCALEIGDSMKYLGVTFQSDGSFRKHIEMACMKGRQLIGASALLLKNTLLKAKIKRLIYNSIIRPGFTYASAIWCDDAAIRKMEVVVRRAYRMALGMYRVEGDVKMISNKIISECMENKVNMIDRILRDRERFKSRREKHENSRVRDVWELEEVGVT